MRLTVEMGLVFSKDTVTVKIGSNQILCPHLAIFFEYIASTQSGIINGADFPRQDRDFNEIYDLGEAARIGSTCP